MAVPGDFPDFETALESCDVEALYLSPTTYSLTRSVDVPAGGVIHARGATIQLDYSDTTGHPAIDVLAGGQIIGQLNCFVPSGRRINRFIRGFDSDMDGVRVTSVDQQPNNNFRHDNMWSNITQAPATNYNVGVVLKEDFAAVTATWYESDMSFAAAVTIPASPSGVILDGGNNTLSTWLGFTGSDIVFRTGDSSTASPANCSNLRVAYATACGGASLAGRTGIFYGQIDVSEQTVRLWFYDSGNYTLYGIGEATPSGAWTQISGNVNWSVGQVQGGSNCVGETATAFNGTVTSMKFYTGQTDLNYQDVSIASRACESPDNNHGAILLRSQTGNPVKIGDVMVEGFDYGFSADLHASTALSVGEIFMKGTVRGAKVETAASVTHGDVRNAGAAPNRIRGHVPGQNTMLLSDVATVSGGDILAEDMAEHGGRVGQGATEQEPSMVYRNFTARRVGQSGLKVAGAGGRPVLAQYETVTVEDAGYRADALTRSPGLNEAGALICAQTFRVTNALTIGKSAGPTYSCNHGLDARGCTVVDVASATISDTGGYAIWLQQQDEGGTNQALTSANIPSVAITNSAKTPVKLTYNNANLGDVNIVGTVNGSAGDYYVEIDVNTDNMAITGTVTITLDVSGAAPTGYIRVTDNAAVPDPNLADSFAITVNHSGGTEFYGPVSPESVAGAFAVYDVSNLGSMWQDTAGTIPAVVDSPVARIDDLTGNGHNLLQATGSKRPTLRSGGGLYWLEFSGTHWLGATMDLSGGADATTAVAVHQSSSATFSGVYVQPGGDHQLIFDGASQYSLAFASETSPGISKPRTNVATVLRSATGETLRIDGASAGSASASIGNMANAIVYVGSLSGDAFPMIGNIYGLAFYSTILSGADLDAVEAFYAGKAGVTL